LKECHKKASRQGLLFGSAPWRESFLQKNFKLKVTIQLSWTQKYFMIENILQSFKNVATLLSVR